jgi:hypothetical protein
MGKQWLIRIREISSKFLSHHLAPLNNTIPTNGEKYKWYFIQTQKIVAPLVTKTFQALNTPKITNHSLNSIPSQSQFNFLQY